MAIDNYDPSRSLAAYFPERDERRLARLWATEKLLHDMAAVGMVDFFEGPGTDPTQLDGFSTTKLWLQVSSGVTEHPGVVRGYAGGDPTQIEAWPELERNIFLQYLGVRPDHGKFETLHAASLDNIALGVTGVTTLGYTEAGDGGGALYKRVGTEPGHPGKFQSADGAWWELASTTVTPQMFGAKGDGVTNDTDAFNAVAEYINAMSGGTVFIPRGLYIVGKQEFAGETGLGYAYLGADIMFFENCSTGVTVTSDGAVLKVADGLKFGAFDPTSGEPYPSDAPFTDSDYRATVGNMLRFQGCGPVVVRGPLELDGNLQNLIVGGEWGNTGRQLQAYGVWERENQSFYIEDVYTHHHALDGLLCGYRGLSEGDPKTPKTLINIRSEFNARQGCSWVGGIGLTAINCRFSDTGRGYNTSLDGVLHSSPASGFDIEAESSICRSGVFINCEFINNRQTAVVADTGDSADIMFIGCRFAGTVWPKKPGMRFVNCKFHGDILAVYGSAIPTEAAQFEGCVFSDEDYGGWELSPSVTNLFGTQPANRVYLRNCTIKCTKTRPGRWDNYVVEDCKLLLSFPGTDVVDNRDFVLILWGAHFHNLTIETNITENPPEDAYRIAFSESTTSSGSNTLTNNGAGIVRWSTWSIPAGGFVGELGRYGGQSGPKFGRNSLSLHRRLRANQYYGTLDVYANNAAPESGEFKRGDFVFEEAPVVGGHLGYLCVEAGEPGTWVKVGNSVLEATEPYDPPSLNSGSADSIQTITVTGAALGDLVDASFSRDLQGVRLNAWVSATNTVSYRFINESGSTVDLASGTVKVRVRK